MAFNEVNHTFKLERHMEKPRYGYYILKQTWMVWCFFFVKHVFIDKRDWEGSDSHLLYSAPVIMNSYAWHSKTYLTMYMILTKK